MAWNPVGNIRGPAASGALDKPLSYTGTLTHPWNAERSGYNFRSGCLRPARAQANKVALGVRTFEALAVGDSSLIEYDGTTYAGVESTVPRQFAKALSGLLGQVPVTDGHRLIVAAAGSALNGSVVAGAGWTISDNFVYSTQATPLTINPMDVGTAVEFTYSNVSPNGFTYSIDGETAIAVTTTGAQTYGKITRTGLAYGKHTLVINGTASGNVAPYTYCVWDPTTPSIRVHNLALGGSRAATTPSGQNLSDTTVTGYGAMITGVMGVIGVTPDLLLVSSGGNDIAAGTSATTIASGLKSPRTYFPNAPIVYFHCYKSLPYSGGTAADNTANATYDELTGRLITDVCDVIDASMFDWNDWVGGRAGAIADGVIGADNTHPINSHKTAVGRMAALAFLGLDAASSVPVQVPMQLNRSSTLYEGWFQSDPTTVGNINHTLPANPRNGCPIQVAHNGTANTVTLALGAGQTFEGSTSALVFNPNERITVTYRAIDKVWTMRRGMVSPADSVVVRSSGRTQFNDPVAGLDAANKNYVDTVAARKLPAGVGNVVTSALIWPWNVLSASAAAPVTSQLGLFPIDIGPGPQTIKALGFNVTTAAAGLNGSAVCSVVLYADSGRGDGPTVSAASLLANVSVLSSITSTGIKLITVSQTLLPGRYWAGLFYYQGAAAPTTAPQFTAATNGLSLWSTATGFTSNRLLLRTGLTAVPTDSVAFTPNTTSTCPVVAPQAA